MRWLQNAFLVIVTVSLAIGLIIIDNPPPQRGTILIETEKHTLLPEDNLAIFDYIFEYSEAEPPIIKTEEESGEAEKPSGSLAVNTNGTALGKISEQFLSPYSAKYSYNNVYMKNSSGIDINLSEELAAKLKFSIKKSGEPEVLIMHTHATESYMSEIRDYYTAADPSRTTDNDKNVTHIGEIIANRLKAAGIGVLHDKTQHDHPAYTGSYSRSEVTVNEYLKKYPSIKIVLDIHRDSISLNETDRVRPVAEINGKRAAQVMLCMGSQSGTVKNHPNWRENFRLALRLQQTLEVMYPGLARPIVLASKLYNQNLTTGSLLIEMGTESNTLSEAEYSAELTANALVSLLNTLR